MSNHSTVVLLFLIFLLHPSLFLFFFFNDTATTEIYTLSLHDALPISFTPICSPPPNWAACRSPTASSWPRSEEHTSELQSPCNLVCRLLLEKKKQSQTRYDNRYKRQHDHTCGY